MSNTAFKQYKDKFIGKRVYIIGNGPSLKQIDLDLIDGEYSIAMNRISLIYPKTKWRPTFYLFCSTNCRHKEWGKEWSDSVHQALACAQTTAFIAKQFKQYIDPTGKLTTVKWFSSLTEYKNHNSLGLVDERAFSRDISKSIDKTGTTMNLAFQMAYYMGFSEVIVLGADLGWKKHHGSDDVNHFDPSYKASITDGERTTRTMRNIHSRARSVLLERGCQIYNASARTELDVHPLIDYQSLAQHNKIQLRRNEMKQLVKQWASLPAQYGQYSILSRFPSLLTAVQHKEVDRIIAKGALMDKKEYVGLLSTIKQHRPCNLLVFGLGQDSGLVSRLNKGGHTVFLENLQEWIDQVKKKEPNLDIRKVDYHSRIQDADSLLGKDHKLAKLINLPKLDRLFDVIFVDAPVGHPFPCPKKNCTMCPCPGRMTSIFSAKRLCKPGGYVVVDDYRRKVEQQYARHYFGDPLEVINGKTAIFVNDNVTSATLPNNGCKTAIFVNDNVTSATLPNNGCKTVLPNLDQPSLCHPKLLKMIQGKRVVIVGPSSSLTGTKLGSHIDSYDVVVRVNRGIEPTLKFSADIGSRTDILYNCLYEHPDNGGIIDVNTLEKAGVRWVCYHSNVDYKGRATSGLPPNVKGATIAQLQSRFKTHMISPKFYNDVSQIVKCRPNTGFIAIFDLLLHQPKELHITGYSFYMYDFIKDYKNHLTNTDFVDRAFNSKRHVQHTQWKLLKDMVDSDPRLTPDQILKQVLSLPKLDRKLYAKLYP